MSRNCCALFGVFGQVYLYFGYKDDPSKYYPSDGTWHDYMKNNPELWPQKIQDEHSSVTYRTKSFEHSLIIPVHYLCEWAITTALLADERYGKNMWKVQNKIQKSKNE